MSERRTRKAMIVVGLGLWLTAIAWPGFQWPVMLAGVAMVMFAVFGLIADGESDG